MPDEFRPATEAQQVEYKAFARPFEHPGEDPERRTVLYLVATMTFPDSGWRVLLVPQEGDFETWRLLEDEPPYRDGSRTYAVACGSSQHPVEEVPKTVRVIDGKETHRVAVVPWD